MNNFEKAEKKLKDYNQTHILDYLENLENEQKDEAINQILELDFEKMKELFQESKKEKDFTKEKIEPIECIDKEKIDIAEKIKLQKLGEEIIKNNQYAVVTMAGGQGTRLGFDGPKGTFKLDIGENGKYIFEILAETLKKSKELYDVMPYWYIMTSEQNHNKTVEFFKEHNFFEYDEGKINFFKQADLPLLTLEGKMVWDDEKSKIKTASNGNGGVYKALETNGMIDDMRSKNVKWVYISGVDNIMVKPIDALFIGLTISKNENVASKSIIKDYPDEKIGAFCRRNGKIGVIEYIELSQEMRNEKNANGDLKYGDSNFVSHLLTVDAIEKIAGQNLRFHAAVKNNMYKFEEFIFDGFEFVDNMVVMRVKREEEFAPIKNKEGIDSPETAKKIYERNYFNG